MATEAEPKARAKIWNTGGRGLPRMKSVELTITIPQMIPGPRIRPRRKWLSALERE